MFRDERGERRCAVLYVREDLPGPTRRRAESVADHLATLGREGHVDACEREEWAKRVPQDGPGGDDERERFETFRRWARRRGVDLRPFFETRECYSSETGERGEWLVFPAICLAVYEDGDLAGVYPHADGDDYRTVEDGLSTLEAGTAGETTGDRVRPVT